MAVVQQAQFTPLPEALCLIIRELNHAHVPATLDNVQERLHERYRGMQRPSEEIVYETLGSLLKERKIYHTGNSCKYSHTNRYIKMLNGNNNMKRC